MNENHTCIPVSPALSLALRSAPRSNSSVQATLLSGDINLTENFIEHTYTVLLSQTTYYTKQLIVLQCNNYKTHFQLARLPTLFYY